MTRKKLKDSNNPPPPPTHDEVKKYNEEWANLDHYPEQEKSLQWLFNTYPQNCCMNIVLVKCATLNDFYNTHKFKNTSEVAQHVVNLNIDDRLQDCKLDLDLVNELANLGGDEKPNKALYSFATKYCSHHYSDIYPIYDSFVEAVLRHFAESDAALSLPSLSFSYEALRDYPTYYRAINRFKEYYKFTNFDFKDIDRYLWLTGKKYFE